MNSVTIERTINVPLDKVWAAAGDFEKSPGPSILIVLTKKGDTEAYGVGSERTVLFRDNRIYELLESVDPPNSFTYRILSGARIKSSLGRVEFKADGDATIIKWSAEFIPKIPGIGHRVGKMIAEIMNQFIDEWEKIK